MDARPAGSLADGRRARRGRDHLRTHSALRAKAEIGLVSEVFGAPAGCAGPATTARSCRSGTVAARGRRGTSSPAARPCCHRSSPTTPTAPAWPPSSPTSTTSRRWVPAVGHRGHGRRREAIAREALRGMPPRTLYDVPIVGGHLTLPDGPPSMSAFGVGRAARALHDARPRGPVADRRRLHRGAMRTDFPFFPSFDERGDDPGRRRPAAAGRGRGGACVAAKDVSMAGLVGSLAMLLEWNRLGVTLDLDALPAGGGAAAAGSTASRAAFLMCGPPGRRGCLGAFAARGWRSRSSAPSTTRGCCG